MTATVDVSPANSVVLITGTRECELPDPEEYPVGVTPEALRVATLCEFDGTTRITLQTEPIGPNTDLNRIGSAEFRRVDGSVEVLTVTWEQLLAVAWESDTCRVDVFADDGVEPERIVVVISESEGGVQARD